MKIDKDTKLFFSISEKPGNFGATFFNFLFDYYGINAIYKPLKCETKEQFHKIVDGLVGIASGISVSMPFKKEAYKMCMNDIAANNANMLVSRNRLCIAGNNYNCCNTDMSGFENSCESLLRLSKFAVVVGRGAYSDSIANVLNKRKIGWICIDSRNKLHLDYICESDFLINCSPIGMSGIKDEYFDRNNVGKFKYVFDCVVSPKGEKTNLIDLSTKLDKKFVRGNQAAFECALKQAEVYLCKYIDNKSIPKRLLREHMNENGYEV